MGRLCCSLSVVLGLFSVCSQASEPIVVGKDGSISCRFATAPGKPQTVFRFGLPQVPAEKRWRENGVLRGLWVKNGIRYTQTVLVAPISPEATDNGNGPSASVLLVNLEGDNTNSEYAEATASLVIETSGKRQQLELMGGLLSTVSGGTNHLLGALEIPDSGIKVSSGEALLFSGNMPPSLKGSMTWKIPLQPLAGKSSTEQLLELDYERRLRDALKDRTDAPAGTPLLVFDQEQQRTGKR